MGTQTKVKLCIVKETCLVCICMNLLHLSVKPTISLHHVINTRELAQKYLASNAFCVKGENGELGCQVCIEWIRKS